MLLKAKWNLPFKSLKMKNHRICNDRNVKTTFVYYKTFEKKEEAPNLVQQPLSQICFKGELATGTMTQRPSFLPYERENEKNIELAAWRVKKLNVQWTLKDGKDRRTQRSSPFNNWNPNVFEQKLLITM